MIYDKELFINLTEYTCFDSLIGEADCNVRRWKHFKFGNRKGYCHSVKGINLGCNFYLQPERVLRQRDGSRLLYYRGFNSGNLRGNINNLLEELATCTPRSHIILVAHSAPNDNRSVYSNGSNRSVQEEYSYHSEFLARLLSHYLNRSNQLLNTVVPVMGATPYPRTLQISLNVCDAVGIGLGQRICQELQHNLNGIPFNLVAFRNNIVGGNVCYNGIKTYRFDRFENPVNGNAVHRVNKNESIPRQIKRVYYSWSGNLNDYPYRDYKNIANLTEGIGHRSELSVSVINAANNYINNFNRFKSRGSWFFRGHYHGMNGRYKVSRLKEVVGRDPSIENTSAAVRSFFNNNLMAEDGQRRVTANVNANPHSFISFLLNEFIRNHSRLSGEMTNLIFDNLVVDDNVSKISRLIYYLEESINEGDVDFRQNINRINQLRKNLKKKIERIMVA
jgi:hypothetical protein